MKEQYLQKRILDFLSSRGAYAVKIISANHSGVPDILACVNGKFVAIEVKNGTKLSELQEYNIRKIQEAGGIAIVSTSLDDIRNVVKIEGENEKEKV